LKFQRRGSWDEPNTHDIKFHFLYEKQRSLILQGEVFGVIIDLDHVLPPNLGAAALHANELCGYSCSSLTKQGLMVIEMDADTLEPSSHILSSPRFDHEIGRGGRGMICVRSFHKSRVASTPYRT
jgi:hypothetical protein